MGAKVTRAKVAVLGAGGWGTALASLVATNGRPSWLWARRPEFAAEVASTRRNERYLAGVRLPDEVHVTSELGEALEGATVVILAVPSHGLRAVLREAVGYCFSGPGASGAPGAPDAGGGGKAPRVFASAAKGLEMDSFKRMSQVLAEELPSGPAGPGVAVISGPNFAAEVAKRQPAATVVASPRREWAEEVQDALVSPVFRVYTSPDVVGVEIAGALKNVYAIGTGIADGLGLGLNARAAVITRGLAEMTRLGMALGAHPLTFSGLAGVGDLLLTCTGDLSRNRRAGLAIGRGEDLEKYLGSTPMVVEGVRTTAAARDLAARGGVEMPILDQVYQVLFENKPPAEAVADLMTRLRRSENDGLGEHAATW